MYDLLNLGLFKKARKKGAKEIQIVSQMMVTSAP